MLSMSRTKKQIALAILSALLIPAMPTLAQAQIRTNDVGVSKVMEVNEITFHAEKQYANPYLEVDLWVDLSGPNELSYRIPAFWDGGQTFRARLVATDPGDWRWSTRTTTGDRGLDNKSGSFKATAWTEAEKEANPNRRGFIRVAADNHSLEYADGTPFFYTADTWWTALTGIYAWGTDDCVGGISFQDAIALRKSQGFNSINLIAAFPSDTIKGLWNKHTHGEKVGEDGATPFVIADPSDAAFGVDYKRINPRYWQQADRKWRHMWDNGFVPYMESVRRHEQWYDENTAERNAFVNYTRYLWARYGCYNMIYSWIHAEGVENPAMSYWKPMVNMAYNALGRMPYGQPRTLMAWGSTLTTYIVEPDAVPIGAFDIHNVSNRYRDYNMFGQLRDIYDAVPTLPGANVESFYPGWGGNKPAEGLDLNSMAQFMMYGCVLNGAFAGYAWGDGYYAGAKSNGEPHGHGFNDWNAHTMGHLKAFILDEGHDYRTLRPVSKRHLADNDLEWCVLAIDKKNSTGLGFIAANKNHSEIIHLSPDTEYKLEWYDIDTGVWSNPRTLSTDGAGKLMLPDKPNSNGWAFRIKTSSSSNPNL